MTVDSVDVVFGLLDDELCSVVGAGALSDVVGLDEGELLVGDGVGVGVGVGVDRVELSSAVDLCPVGVDLVAVFFVGDGEGVTAVRLEEEGFAAVGCTWQRARTRFPLCASHSSEFGCASPKSHDALMLVSTRIRLCWQLPEHCPVVRSLSSHPVMGVL